MSTRIVGLVGLISSGKNTVSDILEQDFYFEKESFAGPLKDACANMFGWPRVLLEGDTEKSRLFREQKDDFWSNRLGYDFTPRLAMQLLGTEGGRNVFGESIWVSSLEHRIQQKINLNAILRKEGNIVISDVRFPNEINMLRERGSKIFQISRGIKPIFYEIALEANKGSTEAISIMQTQFRDVHVSEWAWIGQEVDGIIENDGTLNDLKQIVKSKIVLA